MHFNIEKKHPSSTNKSIMPFDEVDIGDSLFVEADSIKSDGANEDTAIRLINKYTNKFNKKNNCNVAFNFQRIDGGVRASRIK